MPCPDDNVLVAMHALEPALFAEIELHIDTCEHCRKIVAAAVASKTLAVGTPSPNEDDALASLVDVSISGRYVIEAVLGRGGMGTVYLARDQTLGRDVALKLHRAGSGNDRLHREALAMAKLAHPNVVTVFEIGSVDDRLYVAMEYVRGETLRGWLDASKRKWRQIVDMLAQAGTGLAAAHTAGLVHRDFKPENVLVGEDGRPRVSDFGLARVGASRDDKPSGLLGTAMTQTGTILGTPAYMAPEQLAGETVDARCDQFAFCVVVWESLFAKRPFAGNTLASLEESIHRQEFQLPAKTDVPQRVRDVIERGLAVKAVDRYADMHELLAALRRAAAPRTKRYAALAIVGAVVVGGGAIATMSVVDARRKAAACEEAGNAMRRVFDVTKRTPLLAGFVATGFPHAVDVFGRTAKVLDDYSEKLAVQARAVCHGGGEPVGLIAAKHACLVERKAELQALVDVMGKPDASIIARGPSAAWAIYEPAPCSDPSTLLARPVPAVRRSSEEAAQLRRARTLHDSGQYRESAEIAAKLLDSARARKDRTLELAALNALASAKIDIEDPATVAPLYHEAVQLAETMGRDLDAAGSLWALANLHAVELQQYEPAHRYVALARAKLDRLGNGNLGVRGELLVTEAQVFLDENRLGEADKTMQQAIATLEQAYGPNHPKLGSAFGSYSQILRAQSKDSLAASERTLQIFHDAYGPDHPTTAGSSMNLAQALMDAERYPEARERLVQSDRVFARVFGDGHPLRASIAANLAEIEKASKNWDAALVAIHRAIEILEAVQGPESADVSGARRDLARILGNADRVPEAITEMKRAIAILEKLGADGETRIVSALSELAEYELHVKQPLVAIEHVERALKIQAKRPSDANPQEIGDAKFVLARALWEANRERSRARKLAEEAREVLVHPASRKMLEEWLTAHPAP